MRVLGVAAVFVAPVARVPRVMRTRRARPVVREGSLVSGRWGWSVEGGGPVFRPVGGGGARVDRKLKILCAERQRAAGGSCEAVVRHMT
ncbi:hypothetical protein Sgou_29640 [Streptomyces gougerotii]|uniref:Uncharacterized protein n=2 Tax=Streptomyces diastaticus group TaxID=2849069 RepID=A0A8H9HJN3_9ACTN|nr:hypothetical protein Sdia_04730 [Streptomyces diastaticus subsp. diastaticus]GFH78294.1 hypothetical protein Sgou_29640 [Streptomyces gougerotii]GGU19067.1 hypothetical protein GCM10015534_22320 [Streptomyces diastaticus subsp. diastaticus]GGU69942.1 hypothetical protein GCM10010227_24860 [Streptomyces gougerotii]